jgi:hypothetical protein
MSQDISKDSYSVRIFTHDLALALQKFHDTVWPARTGHKGTLRTNNIDPEDTAGKRESSSPIFLFLKNNEVIGHLGTMSVEIQRGDVRFPAHWVVGLMVLPEFRNGLVGPQLIKKVNESLSFAMTLHVEDAVSRIVKGLKWTHLGTIPQYIHVLNGRRLASQLQLERIDFLSSRQGVGMRAVRYFVGHPMTHLLIGLGARIIGKTWIMIAAAGQMRSQEASITEEDGFDESYDELWKEVHREFAALVVRDRAYLEAKYGKAQGAFRVLACRASKKLRAFCVLKIRQFENDARMGNARVGTVIDCLFNPQDIWAMYALLKEVRRVCEDDRVDAIFCTASHPALQRLLGSHAFFEIPGSLRFAYYDRDHVLEQPMSLSLWHIMRGDADAAANF